MDDDAGSLPRYPIEAVDRTLLLLRLLAERGEVKLSDARAHLEIGHSTAHRLLAMLVYRGFAVQDDTTRAYQPGPAFIELGRAAGEVLDLVRLIRPVLTRLAEETGETVHLGKIVRADVHYLDAIESTSTLKVAARVGRTRPAHATSIGKAMLAVADDEIVSKLYPGGTLIAQTGRTVTSLDSLLVELARVRARGYGRNRGEMEVGVYSVGIALVHPVRGLVGGLSVAAPEARWSAAIEREHVRALRAAAERTIEAMT